MLLLVLLRFAIDLLGLVLVMVLVGFSIRALSDWLSDDDTVSGWSLVAVAMSLCGTIAIGTWLFDVKHIDPTGAIQRRLPAFITRAIDWAEQRGWGQRVLLSDRSLIRTAAPAAPPSTSSTPLLAIEIPPPAPTRPTGVRSRFRSATRETMSAAPAASGSLPAGAPGASSARPVNAPGAVGTARGANAAASPQPPPAAAAPASAGLPAGTRTVLTTWPAAATVGTSVRLTARVEADPGEQPARGTVVFRAGDRVLGTARLRQDDGASSGFIVVLNLPVGEHVIIAEYGGDERHAPSRSAPVRQAVVRR